MVHDVGACVNLDTDTDVAHSFVFPALLKTKGLIVTSLLAMNEAATVVCSWYV